MTLTVAARTARSAAQILDETRTRVEPIYRSRVAGFPAQLGTVAGYHIGWWDADGAPTCHGGKMIRPALVLASAAALGGGCSGKAGRRAVNAAVAVEMVHDFSLLHDDVMDGDRTRRHRSTAWAQFGVSAAVLTGDMLVAAATDLLAADSRYAAGILTRAVCDLCRGQSHDLSFEQRQEVSLSECLHMVEGKTAALLSAACELGAWAAAASSEHARLMREFGLRLGLAFQLVDDVLGIWGDPQVTGKPVFSDLARRKKSLPVIAALDSGTAAGARFARRYHDPEPIRDTELSGLAALVDDAGGRRWAETTADEHCLAAKRLLEQLHPDPDAAADVLALTALITRRAW